MFYKFLVSGVTSGCYKEDLKKQGRVASHYPEHAEEVFEMKIGPVSIKEKTGKSAVRHLTRREIVCGMPGFGGLVSWRELPAGKGEIKVDMARASMVGVSDWVIDFIRDVILKEVYTQDGKLRKSAWTIDGEEDAVKKFLQF